MVARQYRIHSTHSEGKSVVAERFIRTFKDKIYKYMTSTSKNVYIDKLDDIVDEYYNTYHSTIKIKPDDKKIMTMPLKKRIKILNMKLMAM